MSRKQKRVFWPTVIISALGVGVIAFASARKAPGPLATDSRATAAQNPNALANAQGEDYVRMGKLTPQLCWNLRALGDRIEKPGKERLILSGTLSRAGNTAPMLLILEFPDHLRLEVQGVGPHYVITFDGQRAGKIGGPLDQSEEDLIETLVYDTAEHFFGARMAGRATRFLGSRFRIDDGSSVDDSGPYYDLYQVDDQVRNGTAPRQQAKLYYFNSDTQLLERVRYQIGRSGTPVEVETIIGGWQKQDGQQVPRRIERIERGQSTFVVTVQSVVLSPRADDGIFAVAPAN